VPRSQRNTQNTCVCSTLRAGVSFPSPVPSVVKKQWHVEEYKTDLMPADCVLQGRAEVSDVVEATKLAMLLHVAELNHQSEGLGDAMTCCWAETALIRAAEEEQNQARRLIQLHAVLARLPTDKQRFAVCAHAGEVAANPQGSACYKASEPLWYTGYDSITMVNRRNNKKSMSFSTCRVRECLHAGCGPLGRSRGAKKV